MFSWVSGCGVLEWMFGVWECVDGGAYRVFKQE